MKVFYPGSFDPFTIGHDDIVKRALAMGYVVVIGVGSNSDKVHRLTITERWAAIKEHYQPYKNVEVIIFEGLAAEAAMKCGCSAILRGIRNVTDYDYEVNIARVNNILGIDTIFLPANPKLQHISSSMVRELFKHGKHVNDLIIKPFEKFYTNG